MPKDVLRGPSVAGKTGSGICGHVGTDRAHARSVAIELRLNIGRIGLSAQAGSAARDVILRLSNSAPGTAITAGFIFRAETRP